MQLPLDVDPVRLVRGGGGKGEGALDQYVNDRPHVASSFFSVDGACPEKLLAHLEGSTWHKLWPGFRYYVDILRNGAANKYGWTPQMMNANESEPAEGEKPPVTKRVEAKSI